MPNHARVYHRVHTPNALEAARPEAFVPRSRVQNDTSHPNYIYHSERIDNRPDPYNDLYHDMSYQQSGPGWT